MICAFVTYRLILIIKYITVPHTYYYVYLMYKYDPVCSNFSSNQCSDLKCHFILKVAEGDLGTQLGGLRNFRVAQW